MAGEKKKKEGRVEGVSRWPVERKPASDGRPAIGLWERLHTHSSFFSPWTFYLFCWQKFPTRITLARPCPAVRRRRCGQGALAGAFRFHNMLQVVQSHIHL